MKKPRQKGKKGTAEEWLEQIPYIILTAVVMILIFVLVNMLINTGVNVKPVQVEVAFYRILYSPHSIMYTDNITGQIYPGVVDLERFSDSVLDSSIKYSYEKQISARLDLYTVANARWVIEKTAFLNKAWYERLEPLAGAGILGSASAQKFIKIVPVTYIKNGASHDGMLIIDIVIPN